MSHSRRSVLIGSGLTLVCFSGCQRLSSGSRSQIGLDLSNYTERAQPLKLSLLREDKHAENEAEVLNRLYTIPAPEGGDPAGTIQRTDLVPERPYLVRVQPKYGDFTRYHAHYYPDGSQDEKIEFSLRRDEATGDLFVDFRSL